MMSGVAHVIGMKPIFKFVFSSGPLSCAMACKLATGNTLAMAAMAVFLPTARKKLRRSASCGNKALTKSSLDELLAVSLKLGCLGACTQCGCGSIGRDFGMVVGRRVITPTAAFQHQGTIGVVGVKELRHGRQPLFNEDKRHYANNAPTFS
jgi:hypothetical protein